MTHAPPDKLNSLDVLIPARTLKYVSYPDEAKQTNNSKYLFQAPAVSASDVASPPAESMFVEPDKGGESATAPNRVQTGAARKRNQLRGVPSQLTDGKKGEKNNIKETHSCEKQIHTS